MNRMDPRTTGRVCKQWRSERSLGKRRLSQRMSQEPAQASVWLTSIITLLFTPHRPLISLLQWASRARQIEEKGTRCEMNITVMMDVIHTASFVERVPEAGSCSSVGERAVGALVSPPALQL